MRGFGQSQREEETCYIQKGRHVLPSHTTVPGSAAFLGDVGFSFVKTSRSELLPSPFHGRTEGMRAVWLL